MDSHPRVLYHVSEEGDIPFFVPRIPDRKDLDPSQGLVWALTETCLPNYLVPRDCPRVTYHMREESTQADRDRFFSSTARHCVAIENAWFHTMLRTTLYVYSFDPSAFQLQDAEAGYYVSRLPQRPLAVETVTDLFQALFERNVELRIVENLWPLARAVQGSSLNWSLCRMRNSRFQSG